MTKDYTESDYWDIVGMLAEIKKADPIQFDRLLNGLDHQRTVLDDVEGYSGKPPIRDGRGKGKAVIRNVCRYFHQKFAFSLYEQIFNAVKLDDRELSDQARIKPMLGHYKVYYPDALARSYRKQSLEIINYGNMYLLNEHIKSEKIKLEYSTLGQMFLIRKRIHVMFFEKNGLRSMVLNLEPHPSRNYIKGIIMNVTFRTHKEAEARGEEIFATQLLAVHESHDHYASDLEDGFIAKLLENSRARPGVIFA